MQHNSGKLKQTNKSHKGIVTSKRAQKRALGPGKVASHRDKRSGSVTSNTSGSVSTANRLNRINQGQQLKKKKRDNVLLQKRVGSYRGPPKIVAIIPLTESIDPNELLNSCLKDGTVTNGTTGSNSSVYFAQFKAHVTFISAELDVMSVLDAAKLADIIILVVDAGSEELISDMGAICLSAMKAQGCPDLLCCVQGLDNFTGKALVDKRKTVGRICDTEVASSVKVLEFSNNEKMSDASRNASVSHICRQLCSISPKDIGWRSIRSYLLSQTCEILDNDMPVDEEVAQTKTVRVGGYLRGRPLPINSLVHIVGVGTGRIKAITVGGANTHAKGGDSSVTITSDIENQDSLVLEATADGLTGEQTWPTEAEMNVGDASVLETIDSAIGRNRRIIPTNIPAGMSAYQADWYVDEDGNGTFDEEDDEEGEGGERMKVPDDASVIADFENDDDDNASMMEGSVANTVSFAQNTLQSADAALTEKRRLRTLAQAKDDKEFPDELDTPADITARLRFARYRALQSFRSSPWHPKENLPTDYSRIFQFENFSSAQRRILAEGKMLDCRQQQAVLSMHASTHSSVGSVGEGGEMSLDGAEDDNVSLHSAHTGITNRTSKTAPCLVPGTDDVITSGQYVTMEIEFNTQATETAIQKIIQYGYLAVFSLLKHENKLSVMHCNVQRNDLTGDSSIIKSKEELYFQNDRFSVASIYAPITFHPSPVLVFKRTPLPLPEGGLALGMVQEYKMTLVGTGSLGGVDPDRIILKKVILTGHPIRVRKKFAVVKHMFYDPMDVRWFKPAEMVTKHGLRGHIKEPVGTHGLLKAVFSAPIKQNDTVMLILYKRMSDDLPHSRTLRQADYDAYFRDLMDSDGLSVEEAAEQTIESISNQYDVFNLFLYRNKRELDEKVKVETRCITIEKAVKGADSFINANFAFQGLTKILKDGDAYVREGTWHIFESRKLIRSLVGLLKVSEAEEVDKDAIGEADSDSDEEDEDEAKILQTVAVLEFANSIIGLALSSPQYVHNVELFCTLDEETVLIVKSRFDEDIADARVVTKMVDLLFYLLALDQNKNLFLEVQGAALLELAKKMHKKNVALCAHLDSLLCVLA